MFSWRFRAAGLAALALAAAALVGPASAFAGGGQAPPRFYEKNIKLGAYLHDAQDLIFDATLSDVPESVPAKVRDFLVEQLGTAAFEVDGTGARCFAVTDGYAASVDCSELADLVDGAHDSVYASLLAKPVAGEELSFRAKKITVWIEAAELPPSPPPETPPAPTPRFYEKNIKLGAYLHDAQDLIFDATLSDVPESVPAKVRDFLVEQLGTAAFEVDGTGARCFAVTDGYAASVDCSEIADLVDGAHDSVYASLLAKPVAGEELSFRAKKITVWL